jgi:hypothetical protein
MFFFPDEESGQRVFGRQAAAQSAGRVVGEHVFVPSKLPQVRRRLQGAQLPNEVGFAMQIAHAITLAKGKKKKIAHFTCICFVPLCPK